MKLICYLLILWILFFSPTIAVDTSFYPQIETNGIQPTMNHSISSINMASNSWLTWIASYYDYTLDWYWERSKSHSTCAFHSHKKDYGMYRVTNLDNWKSVDCYNNDWMARPDRLVDLSSYWFRQIWDTKKWLLRVSIEKVK